MYISKALKPSLGAYIVGAYLFSVPAFAYSQSFGLLLIPQIMGIILVALAVLDISSRLQITIPLEISLYGLMGLWAISTSIFLASPVEWESLGTLIKVVTATLACAQLIKSESDFDKAMEIFVLSILFVYYLNRSNINNMKMVGFITGEDRFAGTLANANTAAIYSLSVLWASIYLLMPAGKVIMRRIWLFVPISISLIIINYSGSKSGLIGVGLFTLFLTRLLYLRHGSSFQKKMIILLISSLLIIVAGYFIYTSPFFFRIQALYYGESGSDIKRLDLAADAIRVWLTNWKTVFFGVGYDNFEIMSPLQTYSHVTYLEVLACHGIIGLILFLSFLALLFRRFTELYRHAFGQELRSAHFSILIFIVIYGFFAFSAVLQDSRELMPIMGCLGAVGQYHHHLHRQNQFKESALSIQRM